MTAVHQQHVVIREPRESLIHQGTHVVQPSHLLRKKDHGRRCCIPFQSLDLNRHLVVAEGLLDQIPQTIRFCCAVLIGELSVIFAQAFVQFRIDTLEVEILMPLFEPWDELGVDHRFQLQHFDSLGCP